jgi:putative ABC transport system permease protein
MAAKDLRYALRTLSRSPGFTATALLTIALGIGASTAIFSVVNAVLLRPLPYRDADRLVLVWSDLRARNVKDFPISPGDLPDIRAGGTLFEGFAGVGTFRQPLTEDNVEPEQVRVAGVTANIFSLLGVPVQLGRSFVDEDGTPNVRIPRPAPGAAPAVDFVPPPRLPDNVILSDAFWRRRYGADKAIIGKTINLGGGMAHVVGVLAPGAELLFPPKVSVERNPDIWEAIRFDMANTPRTSVFLRVIGRLKPNATVQQGQSQMDLVSADIQQRFPTKKTANVWFRLEPMGRDLVADVKPALLALMGAVTFVLLIACANVANLLLVRASWRERELALRSALGESWWRLVRQMLAESMLLATAGAALGVGLAQLGIKLLVRLQPPNLPRLETVGLDPVVLGFTAVATVASALLFGLVPALRASRPDALEVLRAGSRSLARASGRRLRNAVVMTEVALSFVLLVGSGLMLRSFLALQRTDPGYDPNGLLTFQVNPRVRGDTARAAFMQTMRERLSAIPGVQAVTAAFPLPLDGQFGTARWGIEAAAADPALFQQANVHMVLPGYFEAMRARLLAGRTFTEADNNPNAKVLIIDERLAAKAFPKQPVRSVVGKRLLFRPRTPEPELFEVIGVVANERHVSLTAAGPEAGFFTDGYMGFGAASRWVLRTTGDPARLEPAMRRAVKDIDPLLAIAEVQPMSVLVDRAKGPTRFALVLIGVFAFIAVALATVGLYGVLSSVVRQRTSEIGVRMALGAQKGNIFQLVIGHGLRLSGAGILIGAAGALALTRVMTSMLVGVKPTDPLTFGAIGVLFVGIAATACWLPARRAAGLDPTVALREE